MDALPERELKFGLGRNDLAGLQSHALLKRVKSQTRRLTTVYFDTDKLALHDAQISLRVRRDGRRRLQTIKAPFGASTLFERAEWEHEIKGDRPDPAHFKGTPVAAIVKRKGLRPLFETRVARSLRQLEGDDWAIEAAIDRAEVDTGNSKTNFLELELELKRGDPARLFAVAEQLAETVPLRLDPRSKASRGYDLLNGGTPQVSRAEDVEISPHMNSMQAFRAIARECLRHLLANAPVVLHSDEPEGVHQMRVAIRRLRAALSLFGDVVADGELEEVKRELRWIAGELAEARSADVFIADVLEPLQRRHPNEPGMFELARYFAERRRDARRQATEMLRSQRYNLGVMKIAAWVEIGPWTAPAEALQRAMLETPIATLATEELTRRRKKILRDGRALKKLDARERHRLRIRVKKLRYAGEYFGSLWDGKAKKRRKKFLGALGTLQDCLGELNDLTAYHDMEASLARKPGKKRRGFKARLRGRPHHGPPDGAGQAAAPGRQRGVPGFSQGQAVLVGPGRAAARDLTPAALRPAGSRGRAACC